MVLRLFRACEVVVRGFGRITESLIVEKRLFPLTDEHR